MKHVLGQGWRGEERLNPSLSVPLWERMSPSQSRAVTVMEGRSQSWLYCRWF